MKQRLQNVLLHWLKIPDAPLEPLQGATIVYTTSSSQRYHRFLIYKWWILQIVGAIGLFSPFFLPYLEALVNNLAERWNFLGLFTFIGLFLRGETWFLSWADESWLPGGIYTLLAFALIGYLYQFIFSLVQLWLEKHTRSYLVTDRGIQLREGVWQLHELNMRWSQIEDVTLKQRFWQRWFNIADVVVRSAGGSSSSEDERQSKAHTAVFRDIAQPAAFRDLLRSRINATLAAPAQPALEPSSSTPAPATALSAAQQLLEEMRALRTLLEPASAAPASTDQPQVAHPEPVTGDKAAENTSPVLKTARR